jgi:hypothetical protein
MGDTPFGMQKKRNGWKCGSREGHELVLTGAQPAADDIQFLDIAKTRVLNVVGISFPAKTV